jgi:hypothetical protein
MSQWKNRFDVLKDCQSNNQVNSPLNLTSESSSEIMSSEALPLMVPSFLDSPYQFPSKIYIRNAQLKFSLQVQIILTTLDTGVRVSITALLDSGATGLFLNKRFIEYQNFNVRKLPRAIPCYNVDGTLNQGGSIKEEIDMAMTFQEHSEKATFAVCDLGDKTAIIGHTWLFQHNPEIDWRTGTVKFTRCPPDCHIVKKEKKSGQRKNAKLKSQLPSLPDESLDDKEMEDQEEKIESHSEIDPEDRVFVSFLHNEQHINATSTVSQKLAEESHKHDPEKKRTFEEIVPEQYHQFKDVFSKESFDQLPDRKPWDHAIELKAGSEPFRSKIYPLSPNEQEELDAFLEENLKSGRIQPSKSPMASPVFFVKKKDGSLRLVQDYRKLNDMTIKNSYPLPLISDIISKLKEAKYFTKLDVRWGYNNVRIKEGDEWKAAFRTNRGLFEPLVMFFGLTNSPATFQTMMNDIFIEVIDENVVIVYMDDILVFTVTLDHHRRVVHKVLDILRKNKLYLKAEKCEFEKEKIEYLGLIISHGRIEMDPVKIEGVSRWPEPTTVKEVQSFIGFCNFYRRFIQDFADIAKPLHDLTKKTTAWKWTDEEKAAFRKLKKTITSSPVLVFPSENRPYRLEADSSNFATGAVLSQEGEDGKWHPVAFLSKSLNEVERNYDIHDKEMLAIIRALEEWRHYLEGAKQTFQIWTDHKNLEYFMTAKKLNRRQARWSLFLSRFDFTLHHRPGKNSMKPDALSRRPDHGKGENDNDNVVLLKPAYFKIQALKQGHALLNGYEPKLLKEIRNAKELDESVVKAVEEMKKSNIRRIEGQEWSQEQGLILFQGKVYVPKDPDLRRQIVELHHDSLMAGHPGRWKTLELVSRNYWWPGMSRYIAAYVKGCDKCNRTKTFPAKPVGKLVPTQIPQDIWDIITVDLITGLPESAGYNAIMVVVDRLSKLLHAIPTTDTVTAEGVARLFKDHVWKHHGLPLQVISDRGPQFVAKFMKELNDNLGIKTAASTSFHPQTDGQTERSNQEIEQYLRLFVNHRQNDWVEWLPLAEFSHNNRIQASTRQTPFMLNSGRHPRMGTEPLRISKVESADNFVKRMQSARQEAEAALQRAADDMARFYNQNRGEAVSYQVGDMVWLDGRDIKTDRPSKKLDDKRYGPFKIVKVIGPNAYQLQLPPSMRVHPVFNTVKLRPFFKDTISGRNPPLRPPPIIKGDNPEWEVEYIKDSRLQRGKLQYLVKWKGYPQEESTWEPEDSLKNSGKLVKDFHIKHPSAPRKISALTFSQLSFRPYENYTEITPPPVHLSHWTRGKHIEGNVP